MSIRNLKSIGKDPAVRELSWDSIPGHAPEGYQPLQAGEANAEVGQMAQEILHSFQPGDQVPFEIEGNQYIGRKEPHYHPPPPPGADPTKYPKPWGLHWGVTVFKARGEQQMPSNSRTRQKLLQRITDNSGLQNVDSFFSEIEKEL